MSTVEASRNVHKMRSYVTREPVKPSNNDGSKEPLQKRRRASDKSYREDPVHDHDVRSRSGRFSKSSSHLRKLMAKASKFQKEYVRSWNPTVDEVSKMMYLPMSTHDEVTTKGALQMFIELLSDAGLTDKAGEGEYTPADDIADQLLFGSPTSYRGTRRLAFGNAYARRHFQIVLSRCHSGNSSHRSFQTYPAQPPPPISTIERHSETYDGGDGAIPYDCLVGGHRN